MCIFYLYNDNIHSCDTNDIIQIINAKFVNVNVCKNHVGVQEEYLYQENLSLEEKAELARKIIMTYEFKTMLKDYTEYLIEKR